MRASRARAKAGKARHPPSPFVAKLTVEVAGGANGSRRAQAIVEALAPEGGKGMPGSKVKVRKGQGGMVEVVIEADTMAILRAAVNSYLRVAALAQSVAELAWKVAPGA